MITIRKTRISTSIIKNIPTKKITGPSQAKIGSPKLDGVLRNHIILLGLKNQSIISLFIIATSLREVELAILFKLSRDG